MAALLRQLGCPGFAAGSFRAPTVRLIASLILLMILPLLGCSACKPGSIWLSKGAAPLVGFPRASWRTSLTPKFQELSTWQMATLKFDRGEALAFAGNEACVDEFYEAARLSRLALDERIQLSLGDEDALWSSREHRLYQASLGRMLNEARRWGRFQNSAGIIVRNEEGWGRIPLEFHGFEWSPEDFHVWHQVGCYRNHSLKNEFRQNGLGVPFVVERQRQGGVDEGHLAERVSFPATVVMEADGAKLQVYDPLRMEHPGEAPVPLAKDLTASLAWGLHHQPRNLGWREFFRPDLYAVADRLYFQEPFQPGKIPVIFIHGLFSDRSTWASLYNELRSDPRLLDRYQFWSFQYSTGTPFVRPAAELRRQLEEVCEQYDPQDRDPALHQVILVGHSMGGLVSRLLVSSSGTDLWDSLANCPLDSIAADESTRAMLAERLFFEPQRHVSRVVMIATPHAGSALAGRALGQLADALVRPAENQFQKLLQNNPGVFKESVADGLPTSIDLLNPEQPFLKTMFHLPVSRHVVLHSIIGTGPFPGLGSRSDGVVSVRSAKFPGVSSERYIPASHRGILHHPDTTAELRRILAIHAGCEGD